MPVALQHRLGVFLGISSSGYSSLGSMIRRTAMCKCSDPRDRVYAVQSLPHNLDSGLKIVPDYTKKTAQVYQDLMVLRVESGEIGMLRYCELKNDGPTEMPTWVPNWAETDTAQFFWNGGNACGCTEAVARYQGNGVLGAVGVVFETVSGVREMTFQNTYQDLVDQIRRLTRREIEHFSYVAGGSLIDAFCRTLCSNIFGDRFHPPTVAHPKFKESREFMLGLFSDKFREFTTTKGSDHIKNLDIVLLFCSKRSFIITNKGYIGIAPKATKPGDRVCVLLGCQMPLLLRKTSGLQFQVVGECYIHGLMDGEAFLGPLPDNYTALGKWEDVTDAFCFVFVDKETGKIQYNDPRMELSEQMIKEGNLLLHPDRTMEVTPDMLKRRGVNVQTFDLI